VTPCSLIKNQLTNVSEKTTASLLYDEIGDNTLIGKGQISTGLHGVTYKKAAIRNIGIHFYN
jgi:hypothetical protein